MVEKTVRWPSWSWLPSLTTNALAFGAASFASSVLCTLFSLYVTPVFTTVYQIRDSHFYASHVVFGIWNAVNDPAFAWLIDNTTASGADRRLPAIKYGGPLWCLAFLIPWWPWSSVPGSWVVGLHFCVSICVFDSFLTYVLLVHCALLADLTTDNTLRNNFNNVGSLLGIAGGAAGAASYHLYDGKDMAYFRVFCLSAAAVSCFGFWWTGTRLDVGRLDSFKRKATEVGPDHKKAETSPSALARTRVTNRTALVATADGTTDSTAPWKRDSPIGVRAINRTSPQSSAGGGDGEGDALLYVAMNFVENFNALFDLSFFVFLDTKLFEQAIPRGAHGLLTSLCLYLPKVMTQVLTPVADRFGTYQLMWWCAAFKMVAGVLIFMVGGRAWPVWALLFLGNRLVATAWQFYNLSFADVIDEDTLRNRRRESMSVSVHGVQALFVKPAQSLAPIIGVAFLPTGALKTDLTDMTPQQADRVKKAAFTLMWAVPACCGAIQVLVWRAYRLHGAALKDMKRRLREWESYLKNEHDTEAKLGMA